MPGTFYDTSAWRHIRDLALARDGDRCTVARLLGGDCHPTLHAHHIVPMSEGGAPLDVDNVLTACASHHPMVEALRRRLMEKLVAPRPRCRHRHPYPEGRRQCEERMARQAA